MIIHEILKRFNLPGQIPVYAPEHIFKIMNNGETDCKITRSKVLMEGKLFHR